MLLVFREERPGEARHVAARRLDLDHVGAEVGEQHGAVGAGQHLGEVDHPQPAQRAAAARHRLTDRPSDCAA